MADIKITCEKCGNVVTVSEHVDPDSINCRSCGEKLRKPVTESPSAAAGVRKSKPLGVKYTEEAAPAPAPAPEPEPKTKSRRKKKKRKEKEGEVEQIRSTQHIGALAVFIVFGLIMATLRYGDKALPALEPVVQQFVPLSEQFALLAICAFQILVLLKAFKDNILHGILCLMVPGYAIYYVMAILDDFYLRAVYGVLLIGLGQDAGTQYYSIAAEVISGIEEWIRTGGGG